MSVKGMNVEFLKAVFSWSKFHVLAFTSGAVLAKSARRTSFSSGLRNLAVSMSEKH